jgi:hypothetical protein
MLERTREVTVTVNVAACGVAVAVRLSVSAVTPSQYTAVAIDGGAATV